jgi:hypothetical protein
VGPLCLFDRTMHRAGTNLDAATPLGRDLLEKGVAALDRNWPGSIKNGGKLGIGQGKRLRHGGGLLGENARRG